MVLALSREGHMSLSHGQIWRAIDRLAARFSMSSSGLARLAGLDPTSFNPSKRASTDQPPRRRWPSSESLAKVLEATGVSFAEFASLAEDGPPSRGAPLIGLAQAGSEGFFDDAGFPVGEGWDRVELPGAGREGVYALEVTGESMAPLYRDGDRLLVDPSAEVRKGDRVVVKTRAGEVMAKELARQTANRLVLRSLNPDYPDRTLDRKDVLWVARVLWASQ
ncbi:helix-turn-helix transcriptional regulator [Brevundimonas sp. 2R-24]|uniref:Helix-turn-helix transcriptional regulator n=1 Tax=Peiella sedimenti TaxID=3061083 RepID=A0ABT8SM62_9CAUL|nr:helix-turn-helix transcriptional regulator [Caulobacteraceae bacterium XZ-24]